MKMQMQIAAVDQLSSQAMMACPITKAGVKPERVMWGRNMEW